MPRLTETCPKCAGSAWYEIEPCRETGDTLFLRCMCGLALAVYNESQGILRRPRTTAKVRLPEEGTILAGVITEFARYFPRALTTSEIARLVESTPAKISRYMMVLRGKGLVEKQEDRKGQPGGSSWVLTTVAAEKLDLKPRR